MNVNITGVPDNEKAEDALKGTSEQGSSPVGEESKEKFVSAQEEKDEFLDKEYVYKRTITIGLVPNFSLYRKANDKALPKRRDFIGSSIRSSQILSSNRGEVEAYFPALLGISPNNENFVTRVKQYLNNIQVHVDELGVTFDASFVFDKYRYYLDFKKQMDKIDEVYQNTNKQNIEDLKKALKTKCENINTLESSLYKFGHPVNVSEYLLYRHSLLYRDIAKDSAVINSSINIRFYFKDDAKEAQIQQKIRIEINNAKRNYVQLISDDDKFNAVYVQYCVLNNIAIVPALADERINQEIQLDRFSQNEPIKFNKMCNDRNVSIKSMLEILIARGELIRSQYNQNITTPAGEFIGANMTEAIAWFKNPANENIIAAFKNKLKYI